MKDKENKLFEISEDFKIAALIEANAKIISRRFARKTQFNSKSYHVAFLKEPISVEQSFNEPEFVLIKLLDKDIGSFIRVGSSDEGERGLYNVSVKFLGKRKDIDEEKLENEWKGGNWDYFGALLGYTDGENFFLEKRLTERFSGTIDIKLYPTVYLLAINLEHENAPVLI